MPFVTPPAWVNGGPPARNATNLNILSDDLSFLNTDKLSKSGGTMTGLLDLEGSAANAQTLTDVFAGAFEEYDVGGGLRWTLVSGSGPSPVTTARPSFKISRRENISEATQPNPAENQRNAALAVISRGEGTSFPQVNAGHFQALGGGAVGGNDVCGLVGLGQVNNSGSAAFAMGAYLEGRRDVDTASHYGVEISALNATATDGVYNPGEGISIGGVGAWIVSRGNTNSDNACAVELGGDVLSQWKVGFAAGSNAVADVFISDDTTAAISHAINGTHATAALRIAAGAGKVLINKAAESHASTLLEIASNDFADPLVAFGNPTGSHAFTIIPVRNGAGGLNLCVQGGAGNYISGGQGGDILMITRNTDRYIHLGGDKTILKVGNGGLTFQNGTTVHATFDPTAGTFSLAGASPTSQVLADEQGVYQEYSGVLPLRWGQASGSVASPITVGKPNVKISRRENIDSTEMPNPADNSRNAALQLVSVGEVTSTPQVSCINAVARGGGTTGGADVCPISAIGLLSNSGATGFGMGAYLEGRRSVTTGNAYGMELTVSNDTTTAGTYVNNSWSNTMGMWLASRGQADNAAGIVFTGLDSTKFKVGVGFLVDAIADTSIRDDSSSANSLRIKGSHSAGAIRVDPGAGPIMVGKTVGATTPSYSTTGLEVLAQGNADPLVYFGADAGYKIAVNVQNGFGGMNIGTVGATNDWLTGTATGDVVLRMWSSHTLHLGGTTKIVSVTNDNKLGFFAATPIVQPSNATDLRTALINLGLYASGGATPLDLNAGQLKAGAHGFGVKAAQALANNNAIATLTTDVSIILLSNSGAVTGITMPVGLFDGQAVFLVNRSAASISFNTTPATSRIADAAPVIAASRGMTLVWDANYGGAGTGRWVRVGTG